MKSFLTGVQYYCHHVLRKIKLMLTASAVQPQSKVKLLDRVFLIPKPIDLGQVRYLLN